MKTLQISIRAALLGVIFVLSRVPVATAHGGSTSTGIPGWGILLGGVLGLWIVIGSGVMITDRFLRYVFGIRF